jgi:prolyl-tRNA editing enzyme YbaK/EbsC (Cys-tRNA(Pro) deacylase)
VRQANPDEVRVATGYPVGGVSPLGCQLPVAFDEDLLQYERVYVAGGDGNTLFEVEPRTLAEAIGARVARVADRRYPATA